MIALSLNLEPLQSLTDEYFAKLCQANPDLQLERTGREQVVVMEPIGWNAGRQKVNLITELNLWNRQNNLGVVFDSSTGFVLANGSIRFPSASWVMWSRLELLEPDPNGFLPMSPDFVMELCAADTALLLLQGKMREYLENGVRLGWLIDPIGQQVEIYRYGSEVEVFCWEDFSGEDALSELYEEDVLPGFVLDLCTVL